MKARCPGCKKDMDIKSISGEEIVEIRGEQIVVPSQRRTCSSCAYEFENDKSPEVLDAAFREYRSRHGLLQPEEIQEWRKRHTFSQRELSQLLGWGGVTLSRYENGALQTEAHEQMLRLVMEPSNLLKLVETSGDLLSKSKKDRLLRKLSEEQNSMPQYVGYDPRRRGNLALQGAQKSVNTIFSVNPRSLGEMDSLEGTKIFCDLLRCEGRRLGIPQHKIVVSLNTTVKDGGIDAKVEGVTKTDSLLVDGISYFQIKTGESFKPWQLGDLRKELFGKSNSKPAIHLLGKAVKRCLDEDGRYTLVTFGHDLLPEQHSQAIQRLTGLLTECGYERPIVEVLGQGQIVGSMDRFPSLCLEVNGREAASFRTVASWGQNADMRFALKLAAPQDQLIQDIRAAVRGEEFQHIRVIGEPGIGKTRLALEAVSAEDISPSVIYVPNAEEFQRSSLFNELLKPDRDYTVTLVVDECEDKDRSSIWGALKGRPQLKLLTIDHGPDESSDSSMKVFQCPPLPKDQITEILAGYIGKRDDLSNWSEWCEGSPRVAHAVGDNLKRNPEDILRQPATVPIWDRFVLGHKLRDSKDADQHLMVFRHIALFQRFGFEHPVEDEAKFISDFIAKSDPTITWGKFQSIVQHHRGRRILQGRHTLFIVPKALHVHLWLGFWQHYGRGFKCQKFLSQLPPGLTRWFLQLFIYAHAAPVAQQVVREILSPTSGPFADREFLVSEVGTRFLNVLAEADPDGTLELIESTFGKWPLEELRAWHDGRQNIVWALEKIAVWQHLFPRAARVLVHLALAENARNSNNSKGTLLDLFGVGLGWAATMAPPSERFPILEELVRSTDVSRRALGLELCERWLSTQGGCRIIGVEYQGLKPTVEFWRPKTYGEVFDYWRQAWRFLKTEMAGWNEANRNYAAACLVDAAFGLTSFLPLSDEVMDTLQDLAADRAIDRQRLTQFVIRKLRFGGEKPDSRVVSRLQELDVQLTGTSFWDRFARHVLNSNWDEDHSLDGDTLKEEKRPLKRVKDLVKQLADDQDLLTSYLPRFVTASGHRLPHFGVELAKALATNELDAQVLDAAANAGKDVKAEFVGGYLAGVRESDRARWEHLILGFLDNSSLRNFGIECVWRSGISEKILRKMLTLYAERSISSRAFGRMWLSAREDGISQGLVDEIVQALLDRASGNSLAVCVELVQDYFVHKSKGEKAKPLPEDLTFKLLTSAALLEKDLESMSGYHWHEIAKQFRTQYPERDLELFSVILGSTHNLSRLRSMSYPSRIIDEIVKDHPRETWKLISAALEGDSENRYYILTWLGDEMGFDDNPQRGAVRHIDPTEVISWIQKKPDERAIMFYVALPKTLDEDVGGKLTREFIEAFADNDRISSSMMLHFWIGGWSGPESEYLSRKRDEARQWLSQAKSPKLQGWLSRYIQYLTPRIESARISEERDF